MQESGRLPMVTGWSVFAVSRLLVTVGPFAAAVPLAVVGGASSCGEITHRDKPLTQGYLTRTRSS